MTTIDDETSAPLPTAPGFESSAPVLEVIAGRWSPRDLDPRAEISPAQLRSVLEAGRWAASWGGTAPARFVAGLRGSRTFERLAALLKPGNAWATHAGALVLGYAEQSNAKGDLPYGAFDLGAATAQIELQAVSEGLVSHPMAGFDAEAAATEFGTPEVLKPWVMVAIGHLAEDSDDDPRDPELRAAIRERDAKPRTRPAFDDVVSGGDWGTPLR